MSESQPPKDEQSLSTNDIELEAEPSFDRESIEGDGPESGADDLMAKPEESEPFDSRNDVSGETDGSVDETVELLETELSEASAVPLVEPVIDSSKEAVEESSGPSEPSTTESSVQPKKSSKVLVILIAILLVLIVAGVSLAGYFSSRILQQVNKIEQFDERIIRLTKQVSSQKSQAEVAVKQAIQRATKDVQTQTQSQASQKQLELKLEGQLKNTTNDFRTMSNKNLQQMDMLQKRVDGHQQRLLSLSTTSREDWVLAEAEYLLKLANQRVLLERTSDNAVALLETADQLVGQVAAGLGDAELFAIRKAISRDLAALKLIEAIDRDGVYLKLQALAEKIDQLPRVPNHTFIAAGGVDASGEYRLKADEVTSESESSPIIDRIWREFKAMAGTLNQYVKIEDATAPAKPLVDQHFTQVAGLNVRLLLEQSQIALLKESSVIYKNSLDQAHELIGKYYIHSQPATEFQKSIAELSIINIAPTLPDISQSLKLLHAYIRQLHNMEDVKEGQL